MRRHSAFFGALFAVACRVPAPNEPTDPLDTGVVTGTSTTDSTGGTMDTDTGSRTDTGSATDTGAPRDTAATDTTEDTGVESPFDLALSRGTCDALVDPWTATSGPEAIDAAASILPPFSELVDPDRHGDGACPRLDVYDSSFFQHWTWTGGCTTEDGWNFRGVASQTFDSSGSRFDFYDFRVTKVDAGGSYFLAADGELFYSDETGAAFVNLTWGLSRAGDYAEASEEEHERVNWFTVLSDIYGYRTASDGYGAIDAEMLPLADPDHTLELDGYARLVWSARGATGDFCFDAPIHWGECDAELAGAEQISGGTRALLTWDAEVCDGCTDGNLDGVEFPTVCP